MNLNDKALGKYLNVLKNLIDLSQDDAVRFDLRPQVAALVAELQSDLLPKKPDGTPWTDEEIREKADAVESRFNRIRDRATDGG